VHSEVKEEAKKQRSKEAKKARRAAAGAAFSWKSAGSHSLLLCSFAPMLLARRYANG
jgi:hypothetical protein